MHANNLIQNFEHEYMRICRSLPEHSSRGGLATCH